MKIPSNFDFLDMNPSFEKAIDSVFYAKKNTLIMGNAGSGKSTFFSLCKAIDEENRTSSAFLAFTGVSAVLIDGQTIHSFFKLPLNPMNPEEVYLNDEVSEKIRSIKRLYLDECSFIRADIIDIIDSLCKRALEVYHRPFGGLQVVLSGDIMQLKTFVSASDQVSPIFQTRYYDGIQFFNSSLFKMESDYFTKIEFSKIYRQKALNDTDVLNRIRIGEQTQEDLNYINRRVMSLEEFEQVESSFITLTPYNKTVQSINARKLSEMKNEEMLMPAEISGQVNFKNHRVERDLYLKEGCKIMTLINNFDAGYQNGSIGTFVRVVDKDTLLIRINNRSVNINRYDFNESVYEIEKGTLTQRIKGTIRQFPIMLAFASSIHKSQGSTYNSLYLELSKNPLFGQHMCYVALSRVKDLNKLGLSRPLTNKDIKVCKKSIEFLEGFTNLKGE